MKKIIIFLAVLSFLGTASLFAADPIEIEGIENIGMGGPGLALNAKYATLYNPALLGLQNGFHLRLIDLPVTIGNDIINFYKYYNDNQDDLTNFDSLTASEQSVILQDITDTVSKYKVRFKLSVANPNFSLGPIPFFGNGGLNIGCGLYNIADIGVRMNSGILVPTVDFWGNIDAVLLVPASYKFGTVPFNLPGELYGGVNLKFVYRTRFEEKRMSILDFDSLDFNDYDLEPGKGIGWDLGMLYAMNDKFNCSLVLKDLFSTRIAYNDGSSEVIKGQFSLGASYSLNKMILLAADLRDLKFSDIGASTIFTKLYMGGELNLLRILKLRGGFYQGYPSFGFGFLGFLNYAFYGRELSEYPGLDPEWNHMISISIGF